MNDLAAADRLPHSEIFHRPRVNIVSACLIAGVSRATLYRWISLGKVEIVRTPSGQPRVLADTLLRRAEAD